MTNDEIEGDHLLVFATSHDDDTAIETGLMGTVIEGVGFVVPFQDWMTADECLRIIQGAIKRKGG
jgi:hypothetical protein